MTAGEFVYLIKADSSSLNSSLDKAESTVKNVGDKLTSWTVAKGQMVANFAMKAVKEIAQLPSKIVGVANEISAFGDKIDKQSQALGMTRKAYQEWDYILGQNGASIDSMSVSVKTLNSMLVSGSKEGKEAMNQLGLSIDDINKMDMEGQFEAVVRAFQKMPAGAEKSALAVKLFGRNGMELLPLLNKSADSLDTLRKEAQDFGLIMGDDMVDSSVKYGDTVDLMKRSFNALKMTVGQGLLPTFTRASEIFAKFAGRITAAFKKGGLQGAIEEAKTIFNNFINNLASSDNPVLATIGRISKAIGEGFELFKGEDGGIKLPSASELWEKLKPGVEAMWEGVKGLANSVLKLVFGETEDGGIDFPTPVEIWEKIKGTVTDLWNGINTAASDVLKLVFGETEDGGIAFPSADELWEKIKGTVGSLWDGVKTAASDILKLVFGEDENGGINFPTPHEFGQKINKAITTLWDGVKEAAGNLLKLVFGEGEDGGISFPSADEMWKKIESTLTEMWNGVKELAKGVLDLALGALNLPSVSQIQNQIRTWWNNVKRDIALTLGISVSTPKELGRTTDDEGNTYIEYEGGGFGYESASGGGGAGHSFAKGALTIPYDMTARLHRGERVLTASQARRNNEVDYAVIGEMIGESVRAAMSNLYLNMDGNKVADFTTRRTERNINANAFSRVRAMGG